MLRCLAGALLSGGIAFGAPPVAATAVPVQEVVSAGGIKAFLLHEPSVPLIAMSLTFRGGAQYEAADEAGLARMTAALLDEGAGERDSLAFRTALEDNAIRLSFDADRDALTGDLRTLSANKDLAFELLRTALGEPRFDAEPIERIRAQIMAGLKRRQNDPNTVARRAFFEAAFPDHSYAHAAEGTLETVPDLDRENIVGFWRRQITLDKLHIGVAGDIKADELAVALDEIFGELTAATAAPEVPAVDPAAGRLVVVPQAVPQSVVLFGHAGIDRLDPDYYAAHVANYILGGGGFQSRLLHEIREKRGLAYSAYSYLLQTDKSPLWTGGVATNNADVAESVRLMREQVARMADGDISADDLEGAKTFLTGSFPLRLTSNARVASLLMSMSVIGLDVGYLDRRNSLIEAVTLDDVKRVSAALFNPEALIVVVVGEPEGLDG